MIASAKWITAFTVSLALFMDVLDSNIINTAIPAMSRTFQVHPIDLKIALLSYLLSLAVFIPASGWAADKYGAKRIFIAALGLFTISSFWCGYAHTLTELVLARSVQGVGGAFMISLGRLILARTFKRHELMQAMSTVITVVSLAVMLGPWIGGMITDYWSWPWIFWVNVPAGVLTMLLAAVGFKDTAARRVRPFDFVGFVLFGGGLSFFCFSLSELSESGVHLQSVFLKLMVSVAMLMAYFLWARQQPAPIIKIQLLKIRSFRISVLGNLCARLSFGGMPFLLPLLQQVGLGFSAELSGLLLAPMACGVIFSKWLSTRILQQVGYRRFLLTNTLLVALILWLFQWIQAGTSVHAIASLTFIFGIFISAQYSGVNSLAFAEIHEDELSAATSITSTTQVLAQGLGVAVAAILLRYYASRLPQAALLTVPVFHHAFWVMGILTLFSTLLFASLRPGDGRQMLSAVED